MENDQKYMLQQGNPSMADTACQNFIKDRYDQAINQLQNTDLNNEVLQLDPDSKLGWVKIIDYMKNETKEKYCFPHQHEQYKVL